MEHIYVKSIFNKIKFYFSDVIYLEIIVDICHF